MASAQRFIRALGASDAKGICAEMTSMDGKKPVMDTKEASACTDAMQTATTSLTVAQKQAMKTATVKSATVTGTTATVTAKDIQGGNTASTKAITFTKIGDKWYVNSKKFGGA